MAIKIRIASYKEGAEQELQCQCEASEIDVSFDDMRFVSPIMLEGTVEREKKLLRYQGDVSAEVIRVCARTLKEIKEKWVSPFDWFFEIDNDEFIIVDDELRELIILDHPMVYYAPDANKPVEYHDSEAKPKSPFEDLKKRKK